MKRGIICLVSFVLPKLVQQGDYETLVSVEGLYRQMWHAQAQYYKL